MYKVYKKSMQILYGFNIYNVRTNEYNKAIVNYEKYEWRKKDETTGCSRK